MSEKILIVDDEESICDLLRTELELESYECAVAYDGPSSLELFDTFKPNLILLDLMLPGMSGTEVCKTISAYSDIPIIMLTAKSETPDKIDGLENGADDYITKPFDTRELLARIKALLRRYNALHTNTKKKELKNKDLLVFPESQSAYICDNELKLTATEFDVLLLFIANKNKVFSREVLSKELGMDDFQMDTRAIDMHIQRIRKKIAAYTKTKYIETVFGIGYKMRDFDETEI